MDDLFDGRRAAVGRETQQTQQAHARVRERERRYPDARSCQSWHRHVRASARTRGQGRMDEGLSVPKSSVGWTIFALL
jgi:hypothetical protein